MPPRTGPRPAPPRPATASRSWRREIVERRRIEREREHLLEELRNARGRLEAVLRQMPAGVVIAEAPSGRIVLENEQMRQVWPQPHAAADDVPGRAGCRFFDRDGQPYLPHEWPLARSLATGEVVNDEEVRFPRGDGDWGTVLVSSSPIRDPGGTIVATVAVLYDITARKQAEDALLRAHEELERRVAERTADLARANESLRAEVAERRLAEQARDDLLRRLVVVQEEERVRIARELPRPDGPAAHGAQAGAGVARSRADRRRGPAGAVAAVARLDPPDRPRHAPDRLGVGPAALEALDLPTAVSNYAEEWSGHSGVPVQFQCTGAWEGRLPPQVETTLYRVVQEALTNVAKHSAAGRVSLILNRHADDVLVIVEDDGRGFDTERATDPSRPRRGLGLAGMKQRLRAVGGDFQVESTPEAGTTLFVRVPVRGGGGRRSDG